MNRNAFCFVVIAFSICFTSCTTTGFFTSNPKGKVAFAGTEFIICSDSFQIKSWTDNYSLYQDKEGNRIWKDRRYRGKGIYKKVKDSLHLTFTNLDSVTVNIFYTETEEENTYEVSFNSELNQAVNYPFKIKNDTGAILKDVLIPLDSSYTFSFSSNENPSVLHLQGMGVRIGEPEIDLRNLKPGKNVIRLKSYNGYYAENETVAIWFKPVLTGIRYKFDRMRKNRYLPRKWKWGFLNGFYKDY